MNFVLFCHSLVSDWNHGNAHFLRGIVRELQRRGHPVRVWEPLDGWSRANLVQEQGNAAVERFRRQFPDLHLQVYRSDSLDLDAALDGAEVVLVHEWNEPDLIARLGRRRAAAGRFLLLFHDTHHRSITAPAAVGGALLNGYDGVLAFGDAVREVYLRRGWADRVWTWHEAADTSVFRPLPSAEREGDLVWIGNWGDGERSRALQEFLLEPVRVLGLQTTIHGVRYPDEALAAVARAGARSAGWVANYEVPAVFARHGVTVHVPREAYRTVLAGIPTIRVFEALACGIPLVCAPWEDCEGLFCPGVDYLMAQDGPTMTRALRAVLNDAGLAQALRSNGLDIIERRHSCRHRVDELLAICRQLDARPAQDREVA